MRLGLLAAAALGVAGCSGPHEGAFVLACDLRGGSGAIQQCIDYKNVSGDVTFEASRETCQNFGGAPLAGSDRCPAGATAHCRGERANAELWFYAPTDRAAAAAACAKLPGALE